MWNIVVQMIISYEECVTKVVVRWEFVLKTVNSCCWGILVEQKLQICVWWFDTTITSLLWASRKVFLSAFLVQTGLMTMWPLKEAVQTLETVNKYGRIRQGCRPAFVWQRVGEHPEWWRGIQKSELQKYSISPPWWSWLGEEEEEAKVTPAKWAMHSQRKPKDVLVSF